MIKINKNKTQESWLDHTNWAGEGVGGGMGVNIMGICFSTHKNDNFSCCVYPQTTSLCLLFHNPALSCMQLVAHATLCVCVCVWAVDGCLCVPCGEIVTNVAFICTPHQRFEDTEGASILLCSPVTPRCAHKHTSTD